MKLFSRVRQAAAVLIFGLPVQPTPPRQASEGLAIVLAMINSDGFKDAAIAFLKESGRDVGEALGKLGKVLHRIHLAVLHNVALGLVGYTENELALSKVEQEEKRADHVADREYNRKVDDLMSAEGFATIAHRHSLDAMRRKSEAALLELELMAREKAEMARVKSMENWVQDPIKVPDDKKTGN